ncbi:MAG: tail fiber domain-containing protein [Saprospiraceae bacterium]|nr:tail fiber domain-containing protein [Saprospiraceae bacterium]MCF8252082.1 tail fiber domain-containing protein [Saprospiraceae bacterium]MCF8281788.1 tail fiber domain-containing protein [Bacteroidales bacterium]MCF8313725.1 tail fiber domain-containing protein [Saprospiraceae bacterium]MCF8442432.1 tail fiber domain-containing protein [Saprospiraceae bacterium]
MKRLIYTLFLCSFALSANLIAQGATLSVQGVIKNSDGSAVDNGKYDLTFKLYTATSGGTALWTEDQSQLPVTGGIYSALLGSVEPLTVGFNTTYYLGVAVDGGTEMTPRARLTSAPYALSLIGQDNIFPSSGTVGIGTATPSASYKLDVNGSARVIGALTATYLTVSNTINGSITGNANYANSAGSANSASYASSASSANYASSAGGLSSGFSSSGGTFQGTVYGNGSSGVYYGSFGWLNSNGGTGTGGGTNNYSFAAASRVSGTEFNAHSDRRIKKDFRLTDNHSDLDILKKLRVTDYRHVDEIANGADYKKGFIAQEVEEVFPEAVTKSAGFIPDIYEKTTSCSLAGENLTVVLSKNHGLKAGDEVRLMLASGQKELKVAAVSDENTFTVEGWKDAQPEWVFAYGKKVDDFRQVDYDRIHTLNVSATQELASRVEQLEKENAALRQENGGLRSDLNGIESRLLKLENLATGTAQK